MKNCDFDSLLSKADFPQNPYPVYDLLRDSSPAQWSELWGCWLEAPIALNTFLRRLPRLSLETPAAEWSMGVLRALRRLPVVCA